MFLAVDIGNTTAGFGIFKGRRLIDKFALPTYKDAEVKKYRALLAPHRTAVDASIISSVVPELTDKIVCALKGIFNIEPAVLGRKLRVPIKNLYERPQEVGQDRLVNAFAATELYGPGAIVIDFGTAITFDIVSKRGEYSGGIIVPGIGISLDALIDKASLLPSVKIDRPKSLIGRRTRESMKSGIIFGFSSLTDGLVERLKAELKFKPIVIATGGHSNIIASYCKSIDYVNSDLTLIGLNLIYNAKNSEFIRNRAKFSENLRK